MMYKFSKRRQRVWLKNLNRSLKKAHDTGRTKDYAYYFWQLQWCERYPGVFRRVDWKRENVRLAKDGNKYAEEVYYIKKKRR